MNQIPRYQIRWTSILLVLIAVILPASTGKASPTMPAAIPKNVRFETVVSGLTNPLFVTHAGDNSNRLFIIQRNGKILIYKNNALLSTPFLDVSALILDDGGEQGLLGLAFDPDYETNGEFYITYTAPSFAITLARYHVSASDPDQADSNGTVLLSIDKTRANHNGGMLAFGPDNYLYMSTGDGGGGGDPDNNAQDRTSLLGKILRLDVSGLSYSIPPTNPYYNNPKPNIKREIWAYGLRNPWRFSFDRNTGDIYMGDVGQTRQEEINFQPGGASGGQNYGWRILEGNLCYNPSNCTLPANYVAPIAVYNHGTNDSNGCSVTGGYVYRGANFPAMRGIYLYGDFCRGKLWGLSKNTSGQWISALIADTNYLISSFGEDEQGELYLTDYASGRLIHIAEAPITSKTFTSEAANDGFILETSETSGTGGYLNSSATVTRIGDQASNRQLRTVLSFNTRNLPDVSVLLSAVLKFEQHRVVGKNPFTVLGALRTDIRSSYFGNNPGLEAIDFQASATRTNVGRLVSTAPNNNWYSIGLSRGLSSINKRGRTQLRLFFTLDDNDNNANDYLNQYSGNASAPEDKPKLIIKYYIP